MDEQLVQIEVERGGKSASVQKGVSLNAVAGIVCAFEGEPDVTLIISREGSDARFLLAVSGAKAFVGLDSPDGVFQFIGRDKHATGRQLLIIAGQETNIESAYVLCVETAASVVNEWLMRGRQSSFGVWERK